jgi:two-component system sensor histidine kinase YesM
MIIRSTVTSTGVLTLEIVDNGLEINKEKIKDIMESIEKEELHPTFSNVGLQNVHKRIRMMYGDAYGLQIQRSEAEGRTYVTIRLPLQREEDIDEDRGG